MEKPNELTEAAKRLLAFQARVAPVNEAELAAALGEPTTASRGDGGAIPKVSRAPRRPANAPHLS